MDELNKYLSSVKVNKNGFKDNAKRIECNDGEHLSVQASLCHYSIPRENNGPYTHVEVGYPSVTPGEKWREYFDGDFDESDGTDSDYGYIPINLVAEFIKAHGGIKKEEE